MNTQLIQRLEDSAAYLIELIELNTELVMANKIRQVEEVQQEIQVILQFLQKHELQIKQMLSDDKMQNKWRKLINKLDEVMQENMMQISSKLYATNTIIEAMKLIVKEQKDSCKAYNAIGNSKKSSATPALAICSDV